MVTRISRVPFYQIAANSGDPLPDTDTAVGGFGQHSTNEMIYLVGLYCLVSTTLNGFNVPVPERE